jgi:hypothetical protein
MDSSALTSPKRWQPHTRRVSGLPGAHKRIDETMIYVHVAENHRREIPEAVVAAAATEVDPDRRILKMLAARGSHVAANRVASEESSKNLAS